MATTIVNPPQNQPAQNNGNSFFMGAVLLIVVVILFVVFVLPIMQKGFGGAQLNVPSDYNVNIHQTK